MLYICATPIGNLEDVTLRVLRVLKEVDIIAAEDTRQTGKLLNHYEIKARVVSLHQHNEEKKVSVLIEWLKEGLSVALVSDAGMPGISDPGALLIQEAIAEDIPLTVLPGANAAITALVQSGLLAGPFYFHGFLPRKKRNVLSILHKLKPVPVPIIFYEAPHRILATLIRMQEVFGDRRCAISRELTKKFEETKRGVISEMVAHFSEVDPRGEFVVVLEGETEVNEDPREELDVLEHLTALIDGGKTKKEAIKETAKILGVAKNEVYQKAIELGVNSKSQRSE